MTTLLTLEPREASVGVVEPAITFGDGFYAEQGRTRCTGCCVRHTAVEIATHSQTQ